MVATVCTGATCWGVVVVFVIQRDGTKNGKARQSGNDFSPRHCGKRMRFQYDCRRLCLLHLLSKFHIGEFSWLNVRRRMNVQFYYSV